MKQVVLWPGRRHRCNCKLRAFPPNLIHRDLRDIIMSTQTRRMAIRDDATISNVETHEQQIPACTVLCSESRFVIRNACGLAN